MTRIGMSLAALLAMAWFGTPAGANKAAKPPAHDCDRLAGDPRDPDRVAPGVRVPKMDGYGALEACQAALSKHPETPRFAYHMGRAYHALDDYEKAVPWFRKAAEAGYAPAMSILGVFYAGGGGVPRDYDEAVSWYRKSAALGYSVAMYNLGIRYADGIGVGGQDYPQAVHWFERAAALDHTGAMEALGYLYLVGRGVARDDARAIDWFRRAADHGRPDAMYQIANAYDTGRGAVADGAAAADWIVRALKAGSQDVLRDLALHDKLWTPATRLALQRRLTDEGVYSGALDGAFSEDLRKALRRIAAKP